MTTYREKCAYWIGVAVGVVSGIAIGIALGCNL